MNARQGEGLEVLHRALNKSTNKSMNVAEFVALQVLRDRLRCLTKRTKSLAGASQYDKVPTLRDPLGVDPAQDAGS